MTHRDNGDWGADERRYLVAGSQGPIIVQDSFRDLAEWSPDEGRHEVRSTMLDYWRILLKHRLVAIGIFIGCLVLGIAATLLVRPIYTAGTTLQIERESTRVLNTADVSPTEQMVAGEEFFQTQYGLLKSRSLALRIVEALNLANNDFLDKMGVDAEDLDVEGTGAGTPQGRATARKEAAVRLIERNLKVDPKRGSRLVRITFDSPDAALSAKIANAVADNFIAANLDRRFESASYARDFLEQRLKLLKPRLEESERQLVAYAANEGIINVPSSSSGGGDPASGTQSLTAANLVALNSSLAEAKRDRIMAEERWRQAQGSSGRSLPETLQNPTVQQLTQARAKLMATYEEKLRIYKPDFPEMRQLRAEIDETERQLQSEVSSIRESIRLQYNVARSQESSLSSQVEGLKTDFLDLRDRSIQYNILQREVDTNRAQYDALLQRYKEVTVAGGLAANNISVIDRAETPRRPSKPNPILYIGLAMMAGLVLGALTALLLEALDESIGSPEDVEAKLGVSLLGSVPHLAKGVAPAEALADVRSPFSEAYYSIRTALQFSTADGVPSSLLVTSARPSEGKSTSAMAIAQSFARLGMRVLLIDGDLRNPSMHRNLGGSNEVGISNVLAGAATLAEVVQDTATPSLTFVPCGPLPPNPAELLAGPRLRALLAEAGTQFDLVLVDGPPVMGLADAPLLASSVGGTLLVVEAGGTRRGLARAALRRLRMGRARLLGVVLTKFNAQKQAYGAGYGYSYEYEYGPKRKAVSAA